MEKAGQSEGDWGSGGGVDAHTNRAYLARLAEPVAVRDDRDAVAVLVDGRLAAAAVDQLVPLVGVGPVAHL